MKSLFASVWLASSAMLAAETGWTNPILPQRADPHVMLQKDGYLPEEKGTSVFIAKMDTPWSISGKPLHNPDRATRAQVLKWKADGTPDFGVPVPDGPYDPAAP